MRHDWCRCGENRAQSIWICIRRRFLTHRPVTNRAPTVRPRANWGEARRGIGCYAALGRLGSCDSGRSSVNDAPERCARQIHGRPRPICGHRTCPRILIIDLGGRTAMSIYQGRSGVMAYDDVHEVPVARPWVTAAPSTDSSAASREWLRYRKARPIDRLLPISSRWLDRLPLDMHPSALATQYPRHRQSHRAAMERVRRLLRVL
jgi:hypothetical protein